MLIDDRDRLWVRDFGPPWEDQSWRIFSEDGRWLGSATVPKGLRVLDIAGGRLLAAEEDELGVTTVRAYSVGS